MNRSHLGHVARKRFGQNFLVNEDIINKIVKAIAPSEKYTIVEIGPGLGALTEPVLDMVSILNVVELDIDLVERLKEHSQVSKLRIYQGDALKFNFKDLYEDKKLKIFGNLPYNISTPLMFHLFEYIDIIENMHFMLQKEVALRLSASPGSKNYGKLSIMAQFYCQIIPVLEVPPTSFVPAPKVDSAVVRIVPYKDNPYADVDPDKLYFVCTKAFHMRRKTLRNNFKNILSDNDFIELGIDCNLRPEQIDIKSYVAIANLIATKK